MLVETKTIGHTVNEFLGDNGSVFNNDSETDSASIWYSTTLGLSLHISTEWMC